MNFTSLRLVKRMISNLFESIEDNDEVEEALVKLSCVEIYQEKLKDLLADKPKRIK